MGESLYGNKGYGVGKYSQSPYFYVVAPGTIRMSGASTARRVFKGAAAAGMRFNGSADAFRYANKWAVAVGSVRFSGLAAAQRTFEPSADGVIRVLGTARLVTRYSADASGVISVTTTEVEASAGPFWVDTVPDEQVWTPISQVPSVT